MTRLIPIFCAIAAMLPAFAADDPSERAGDHRPQAAPVATHEPAPKDARVAVDFPQDIKQAMLERMRRNLSDIHRIQQALAAADFDRAVDVAENSLGLSSLGPHNARQSPYMPEAMRHMGMQMHSASSRFAVAAQEGDLPKALDRLSEVTGLCVACHATYRAK